MDKASKEPVFRGILEVSRTMTVNINSSLKGDQRTKQHVKTVGLATPRECELEPLAAGCSEEAGIGDLQKRELVWCWQKYHRASHFGMILTVQSLVT